MEKRQRAVPVLRHAAMPKIVWMNGAARWDPPSKFTGLGLFVWHASPRSPPIVPDSMMLWVRILSMGRWIAYFDRPDSHPHELATFRCKMIDWALAHGTALTRRLKTNGFKRSRARQQASRQA